MIPQLDTWSVIVGAVCIGGPLGALAAIVVIVKIFTLIFAGKNGKKS